MEGNGERVISAADVVRRIQQAAIDNECCKDEKGETLVPRIAKLFCRCQSSLMKMVPVNSTSELWEHINRRKRGATRDEHVTAGKLFFSIGCRQVNNNSDAKQEAACVPVSQQNHTQEDHGTPATVPKTRARTASEKRRSATWASGGEADAEEFIRKLHHDDVSPLQHGFHAGHAQTMAGQFTNFAKCEEDNDD